LSSHHGYLIWRPSTISSKDIWKVRSTSPSLMILIRQIVDEIRRILRKYNRKAVSSFYNQLTHYWTVQRKHFVHFVIKHPPKHKRQGNSRSQKDQLSATSTSTSLILDYAKSKWRKHAYTFNEECRWLKGRDVSFESSSQDFFIWFLTSIKIF